MTPKINLAGKKFGRLSVQDRWARIGRGKFWWDCICDCGGKKSVSGARLRSGHTESCGCLKREVLIARNRDRAIPRAKPVYTKRAVDWVGKQFGRLTVLRMEGARWLCVCNCGTEKTFAYTTLQNGKANSCGCLRRETTSIRARTHGCTSSNGNTKWTAEYRAWVSMKTRCNPDYDRPDRRNYSGRGIVVCERWKNSFENFFADVGLKPSSKHSLDRYPNNDGNYEPGNVRWATQREQMLNTRISIAKRQREAA